MFYEDAQEQYSPFHTKATSHLPAEYFVTIKTVPELGKLLDRTLRMGEKGQMRTWEKETESVALFEPEMELLRDEEISEEADRLREEVRSGKSLEEVRPEAFALVREASRRILGQRHYDAQILGGIILSEGAIAEMKTGEGKTLTATLPAFLWSLSGEPVHVVTVNDYLARRDMEWMKPLYEMLGTSVGALQDWMSPTDRHEIYACDIVYGTNSEFGFDYLRDRMAPDKSGQVQRGHTYALVDEVDNILIDEARTPLIISGAPETSSDTYRTFARLARQLRGIEARPKLKSEGETRDTSDADYDYEYDPKHRTVSPTERGVARAEKFLGIEHLYQPEHGSLVNHLMQALRAQSLYHRDQDYAVVEGEVRIIDEHTGRILEGRRWSEGLHQAVEAKEGVTVGGENQTLASITLQNYFRLYKTLSGMTGTAMTEARELHKIYDVHAFEVPTHRPMVREDHPDMIFKKEKTKWRAVVEEIQKRQERGQPVLVGTVSVETSEQLSGSLKREGIEHVVLNAKPENAEREGQIVAHAGRPGRVTIATNMAGRGVDIRLGGDPDVLGEQEGADTPEKQAAIRERCQKENKQVREAGGLFILGTERHESRRIDNQLRGRAGRQGDPGESRFFLSAEDKLLRLFGGDRIYKILDRFGDDSVPVESKMLSRAIEGAQQKVEEQNFLVRKRVLEYDDVLSEQRRVIYRYRDQVLEGEDILPILHERGAEILQELQAEYFQGDDRDLWDPAGLALELRNIFGIEVDLGEWVESEDLLAMGEALQKLWEKTWQERQKELGDMAPVLARAALLQALDSGWREHLGDMDYLREGIHLRGFAQIEPLVAYKNEGFRLFEQLVRDIFSRALSMFFLSEVETADPAETSSGWQDLRGPDGKTPGRNDPCPCGSGRKYKKCHGK